MEQDEQQQERRTRRKSPLDGLIPRGEYFFTPIIININILVFLAMVLAGASLVSPSSEIVMKWGANVRFLTRTGEWWRLFTAMFLHYGIIHLAVNMFALYNVGRMLEPFIGKWRFLLLYLVSGLGGSVASVWWNDNAAAAGASGAIMGIIGVLAALLTTDLVDKSVRSGLLKSIGVSILLTLAMGFSGFVDNAGHIGGLVAGAIGGYFAYFDLKAFYHRRVRQYLFTGIGIAVIAGICAYLWIVTPAMASIDEQYKRFNEENSAAAVFFAKNRFDG